MKLVHGHDAAVAAWAAQRIQGLSQPSHAFGLVDATGHLRGCLMLCAITPHTADLIALSELTLTPNVARKFFRIAFEVLGFGRLQVVIERSNTVSRKQTPRWGFKFDGTAHDFFGPGRDALRFVMLRNDCRWIAAQPNRKSI